MIDLASPLRAIDELIPAPIDLAPGNLPDHSPVHELATTVGANPTTVMALYEVVQLGRGKIREILVVATPLIRAAGNDLIAIGADFLSKAIKVLPGLFVPVPGASAKAMAELALLSAAALSKAHERILQLGRELVPSIMQLNKVGTEPHPELPSPIDEPVRQVAHVSPATSGQGDAAVQAALTQLGTPYVWGGTTPGVGFDCSGFTQWAWRQAGVELPRLAQEQTVGRPVSRHELQAGDLAVWDGHVAMYDGNGYLIEAGDPVSRNPLRETNMGMAFKGYFRPTG